ncbi:hypothetical protein EK21DRAFT_86837 [Setomelanomma holmii]|uniref:Xylanolytic transcriptional activator regulatory domain-containing protein n=1 Tax=Setomelanomma holmii TaxID=210430 RepID=A0A9P4HDW4_9PLEO|nr:hypothetical protein EK21DRAFT_86837 [Setomelanomma holmii]
MVMGQPDNMRRTDAWQTIPQSLFRERCDELFLTGIVSYGEENFARLVVTALGLAAFYSSSRVSALESAETKRFAYALLQQIEQSYITIIDTPGIETVQICILLGSFHLFNGRPNSGFDILGSAINLAQNLGLHRKRLSRRASAYAVQSWARTWWTLEVFDKYAAVAFGRPCAIDDSDCDVDPLEDDPAGNSVYQFELSGQIVSLLSYHRHKFQLYRIMGPFLGRRIQTNRLESLAVMALHRWALYDKASESKQDRLAERQLPIFQLMTSALRSVVRAES